MSRFSSESHDFSKPDLWLCDICEPQYRTENTVEQKLFWKCDAGVLPSQEHEDTNSPSCEHQSPMQGPEGNQEMQAHPQYFGTSVFASKLLMWLRKVTWDFMRLEKDQESLSSACKSKGPSGSVHLGSTVRRCWPRVILFLAQSASAGRWVGWDKSA